MTDPFRVDWMAAGLAGEKRDLAWYLDQARKGDQQAARQAIRWMVESLSPAGQAQNRGLLDPILAAALHALLAPVEATGDSDVLRVARQGPSHRPPDSEKSRRIWWACVALHRNLNEERGLSQEAAAATVIGELSWIEAASLARHYRSLRLAILAYEADRELQPEPDERPAPLPP